jgi:hypothetical protein
VTVSSYRAPVKRYVSRCPQEAQQAGDAQEVQAAAEALFAAWDASAAEDDDDEEADAHPAAWRRAVEALLGHANSWLGVADPMRPPQSRAGQVCEPPSADVIA